MRFGAALRISAAAAFALMAAACSPPGGITRVAVLDRAVDTTCVEKAVRETPGLVSMHSEFAAQRPDVKATPERFDWMWVAYGAAGLTDVLGATSVGLAVDHSGEPAKATITHSFVREDDGRVSLTQLQTAVGIMKRVEDSVASACGVDLKAIEMTCDASLHCGELT